jgi:hypothetical protein
VKTRSTIQSGKVPFIDGFLSLAHIWSCLIWELGGHFARRMEWVRDFGMGIMEFTGF